MATERTLSLVKPDATQKKSIGGVLQMIEASGLRIVSTKMLKLTKAQAEGFYAVHRERPFFNDLVNFMTSGPIVASVLEGENAVTKYRELMGATDSRKATEGTIRQRFGTDVEKNAVHGSDSADNAKIEINYFFTQSELNGLWS